MPELNIPGTTVITNASLSHVTTFRLGGKCSQMIECATVESLTGVIKALHDQQTPFILIGGGSNIVAADQGIDRTVIRYHSETPLIKREDNCITVSGSTSLDSTALFSIEEGLAGLAFTSGIPGTVGGAVVGNAGAWGKQVGDILDHATIIKSNGSVDVVGRDFFRFAYRHSALKESSDVLAQVTFALTPGNPVELALERVEILKKRHEKHPDLTQYPCAGSFFRNIEPTSKAEKRQATGWFLEQAGGKLLRSGGAYIFDKHANIIVKGDGCQAQDVYDLHLEMMRIVREKFGFNISREVRFLGKFSNAPESNPLGYW